ncbi:hypothetical protein SAMN05421813_1292 [Daejeonella rubra]|uniref:Uncharacterized protein n=1 Tax=Daejeonella rubra TaxID=990371 RepID=A0A1G9X6N5_9SPHI|nr:hypothetical protein SAMN05421813_1292 [Daejeonella rubra]
MLLILTNISGIIPEGGKELLYWTIRADQNPVLIATERKMAIHQTNLRPA